MFGKKALKDIPSVRGQVRNGMTFTDTRPGVQAGCIDGWAPVPPTAQPEEAWGFGESSSGLGVCGSDFSSVPKVGTFPTWLEGSPLCQNP